MTKREQVDAVAHAAKITTAQARDALDAVASVTRVALLVDGKIKLNGLGTFAVHQRRPRRVRNPSTGMIMELPASAVIKFKPVPDLCESVKEQYS